jgi:glycosyltransferase involved in cell wall biosynthesis
MEFNNNISVVIPTLGGATLLDTIKALNKSNIRPYEILICIPKNDISKVGYLIGDNVFVISCDFRGQVFQRSCGFKISKSDFVLQIDDDLIVDPECISLLLNKIKVLNNGSIAPGFYDSKLRSYYSWLTNDGLCLPNRFWCWISNNSKAIPYGKISLSGVNYGFNKDQTITKTDWLPGGCILHKKENLVLENYYPFKGKAYLEDLYHSEILRSRGVNLYIYNKAKCLVSFSQKSQLLVSPINFFKNNWQAIIVRINFARTFGYSEIRLYFFMIFIFARVFFKKK